MKSTPMDGSATMTQVKVSTTKQHPIIFTLMDSIGMSDMHERLVYDSAIDMPDLSWDISMVKRRGTFDS